MPGSLLKHTGKRNLEPISKLPTEWFYSYSSLQAEVGLSLIDKVADNDRKRIEYAEYIKANVTNKKFVFPKGSERGKNVYWQLVAYVDDAVKMQKLLHSKGIDTATTSLTYIASLPLYPYQGNTPVAKRLHNNGLFIPCYPELSKNDIEYICKILNEL